MKRVERNSTVRIVRLRAQNMSENVLQQLQSSYARLQEGYDRVNRELDRLHHFLPLLLQHMTEATLFLDLEGTALLCNEAAGKILNLKGEEILRKRFWDVFPDDHFGFSMRETLTFGIPHKLLYNRLDSKELEITATFFYEGAKSGHGLLIILRDISEKQKLHALAHRSDRMRELGERVATIAHEIRNPLGGIRGHAALLYRDLAQDQHLQEMASFILEGTRSLEKLVTMVLHYARPVQILLQSTEMGQFLQQLIRFIKVDPACPPQVKWDLHIPKDSLLVPIDPEALKSALLNLILNALQAMPRG